MVNSKVLDLVRIPCMVLVVLIHITSYGMHQVNMCSDDYFSICPSIDYSAVLLVA